MTAEPISAVSSMVNTRSMSPLARRRAGWVVVGLALVVGLTECTLDELELEGKACPCASGWTCHELTNACVQGNPPPVADAGMDAESDADAAEGGGGGGGCEFVPGVSPGQEGPRGWPSCSNGVDDDCDGFTDELDADCGYVYSVVTASSPPVIDGSCSEYRRAQSLSLRADADNVAVYWMMWDQTAIYVCAEITDTSLNAANTDPIADRDGNVWADDALELYFDVDHDTGPSLGPGDYKFFVNVANVQADSEDGSAAWSADYESSVQSDGTLNTDGDTDGGFTAEFAVTWLAWGISAPQPQDVWGGDLMWNDQDAIDGTARSYEVWSNTVGGVNTPDGFGDLLFLD